MKAMLRIRAELLKRENSPESCTSTESDVDRRVTAYNASAGDRKDGYHCKVCNDRGMIAYNANGEFRVKRCKCMGCRISLEILKESGLENLVKTMRFDTFLVDENWQKNAKETATAWAADPQGWLFLCGASGCGKTHLCTAAARELMLKGRPTRYILWRTWSQKVKAASMDAEARKALTDPLKDRRNVVYIDDFLKVGKNETPTTADISLAYEILNARYNDGSPTIISTERTISEICDLDEALGSRIYQMCKGHSARISGTGKNYRMKEVIT